MADMRIHVGVIIPKSLESTVSWIKPGETVFDGQLRQTRIDRPVAFFFEAFGAISFENGSIEIPEDQEGGRVSGVGRRQSFEDCVARLKNLLDDSGIVWFFGAGKASGCQAEQE